MYGDATPDGFRFYFPKSFIDDSVKEMFKGYNQAMELPFDDIVDYINSTIIGVDIPGLKDDGSGSQSYEQGRTKQYKGSLPPEEGISKSISVTFKTKESRINWFIMYMQMREFLNWNRPPEKNFLPSVFYQELDEEDRIILEVIFSNIRIVSISDMNASVQDNGIVSKDFTVTLKYLKIAFKFHQNDIYKY